ncbi:methylisocitrate lyase [Paenibacillus chungangensis]|uniref:Methylisocitrate lyase n=1 Tax=Paenibacillus chungangensis TaxID=696535 RepID=A0ABW3HLQ0_9BACL
MGWLVEKQREQRELASEFRQLVTAAGACVRIPGAHDGLVAKAAKRAGFQALYLSGAAYTASRGLPDIGIVYSNEVAERARELIRASGLPLLVDIDTGFGGVLHAARTAKEMVEAGVAAVQIEDQELPKKCGHLNGKRLIPTEEMVRKIQVIKEVSPELFVIARTDARGVEGIEAAVNRVRRYAAAGADGIFPEALENEAEYHAFRAAIHMPLLANMTEFGRTPLYTAEQFASWGYQMVIYPVTSIRVAAKAYERVFRQIADNGTQSASVQHMQTRKELYDLLRYGEYEALDDKIAKTELPE